MRSLRGSREPALGWASRKELQSNSELPHHGLWPLSHGEGGAPWEAALEPLSQECPRTWKHCLCHHQMSYGRYPLSGRVGRITHSNAPEVELTWAASALTLLHWTVLTRTQSSGPAYSEQRPSPLTHTSAALAPRQPLTPQVSLPYLTSSPPQASLFSVLPSCGDNAHSDPTTVPSDIFWISSSLIQLIMQPI